MLILLLILQSLITYPESTETPAENMLSIIILFVIEPFLSVTNKSVQAGYSGWFGLFSLSTMVIIFSFLER